MMHSLMHSSILERFSYHPITLMYRRLSLVIICSEKSENMVRDAYVV